MPETTWTVIPRVTPFEESEGYGLDAWDSSGWGSPSWEKAARIDTTWVKES